MDHSMGLVSAILIVAIFFPFFYAGFLGSKKKREMKKKVEKTLVEKGAVLNSKEFWGNTFIGISTEKAILYFIKFAAKGMVMKEIGISDIHSCEIVRHTEKQKGKSSLRLLRLDLELTFKNSSGPKLVLNFFDSTGNETEDYELERAERWKALLLSGRVPARPSRSVA